MGVISITKAEFAQKLRAARQAAGFTQLDVATKIERPQQTIGGWETGRSQPDANTLGQLLRLYNCEPNLFFEYHPTHDTAEPSESDPEESMLLINYRSLNEEGQQKMLDYSEDLVTGGRYKKHDKLNLDTKEA